MTESRRMMLDMLDTYKDRVRAGEIDALVIAAAPTSRSLACAYVAPLGDEPVCENLLASIEQLTSSLQAAYCTSCGAEHRGLLCPAVASPES